MPHNHKQVIIMRKDLGMRKGKMIAQGAHASMGAVLGWARENQAQSDGVLAVPLDEHLGPWLADSFKKICVYVESEEELLSIYAQATDAGIPRSLIRDSGLTEFKGVPTYTAVALGPAAAAIIDTITGRLPLL